MLLSLSNTLISKHYWMGLNPCLHIPPHSKFYVMNLVSKHIKDLNSKSLLYRKIGPLSILVWSASSFYESKTKMINREESLPIGPTGTANNL